jgi:hypothetical protein
VISTGVPIGTGSLGWADIVPLQWAALRTANQVLRAELQTYKTLQEVIHTLIDL